MFNLVQSNSSSSCTLSSSKRSPALHGQAQKVCLDGYIAPSRRISPVLLHAFLICSFTPTSTSPFLVFLSFWNNDILPEVKWKHFQYETFASFYVCLLTEKREKEKKEVNVNWKERKRENLKNCKVYERRDHVLKGAVVEGSQKQTQAHKKWHLFLYQRTQTWGAGCSWNTPWLMENCFLTLINHSSGNTKHIQFLPNMKTFTICYVSFITVFPTSFMHAIKASTSSSAHFKHLHKAE